MAETSSGLSSASESLGNSSVSLSCESSSDATSSSVVNVLERLKAPRLSELGRKRTVRDNPPPIGKRTCHGHRASSSEPKGVSLAQRIKENPNEALVISNRLLFCSTCHEELSLKSSSIKSHVQSAKHQSKKKRLESREAQERDIAQALLKYNGQGKHRSKI